VRYILKGIVRCVLACIVAVLSAAAFCVSLTASLAWTAFYLVAGRLYTIGIRS
jgi:hypothetical protein